MIDYEKALEEILKEELLRLANKHLPYKKKSLKEALNEKYPHITTRDGSIHMFKRSELEFLKSLISEDKWDKLKLPITIELNPDYGEGAAIVRGRVEVEVVSKILGIKPQREDEIVIYRPQISVLRRHLRTTTQIAFSLRSIIG